MLYPMYVMIPKGIKPPKPSHKTPLSTEIARKSS